MTISSGNKGTASPEDNIIGDQNKNFLKGLGEGSSKNNAN